MVNLKYGSLSGGKYKLFCYYFSCDRLMFLFSIIDRPLKSFTNFESILVKMFFTTAFIFVQIKYFFVKWWNRELTLKCKFKCYMKPMKDPLGVSPSKGNQGTTRGKEKILLTSVGIEPTTSGSEKLCTKSRFETKAGGNSIA